VIIISLEFRNEEEYEAWKKKSGIKSPEVERGIPNRTQYKKEYPRNEPQKKFTRPKVFHSEREASEYLNSLPERERYEVESRLKGFRSGEERSRVIEQVNKEYYHKADIRAAKASYGTPQEKYEELRSKAHIVYGNAKETATETKKLARQLSGLESREDIAPRLKKGFVEAGKYAIGTAALALTPRSKDDIRNLEKVRKQIEAEQKIENKRIAEEKHQKKLEEISAAGGLLTPKQRMSLERLRLKYRYARRPRPTMQRPQGFLSGFGALSMQTQPTQRPIVQRVQAQRPAMVVMQQAQDNPFGLSTHGLSVNMGQRPLPQQITEKYPTARRLPPMQEMTKADPFQMGSMFAGSGDLIGNIGGKRGKRNTDPFGLSGRF
jgi:hypothetical protein